MSNLVGTSEGADREKEESGLRDVKGLTACDCWSLLHFVGLCCSGASPSDPSRPSPSSSIPDCTPSSSSCRASCSSWTYHSARIQRMMEKRGEFRADVESEIEASKVHWSQIDPAISQTEHCAKRNSEYFDVLRHRKYVWEAHQLVAKQCSIDEDIPRSLFDGTWDDKLMVGEKLAEEGQAEIYAATEKDDGIPLVIKAFKEGSVLEHLEKQFPLALLKYEQNDVEDDGEVMVRLMEKVVYGAMLLRDERLLDRFAFMMPRFWGDLRMLIDQQMIRSHNQDPPFSLKQGLYCMYLIADHMNALHGRNPPILHNDLKAANVLYVVQHHIDHIWIR